MRHLVRCGLIALLLGLVAFGDLARADLTLFEADFDEFGKVPNTTGGICAAASAINGLIYLQNHYPSLYAGTNIIPDWNGNGIVDFNDQVTSRDKMAGGWTNSQGTVRTGIYGPGTAKAIWEMTYYWLADFAPSTTLLGGQLRSDQSVYSWPDAKNLTRVDPKYPDWGFLWDSLVDSKAIHLGILPVAGGVGHAVVLQGLSFDDNDNNGVWSEGDVPKQIGYVDPNGTNEAKWADVTFESSGRLRFKWWYSGADFYIYRAYTQQADVALVPEPSCLVLLVSSLFVGVFWLRRRLV
ncbi:MAG: hypothetical protein JW818_17160 [Pirellulales bacterium]|nr:hypothetical protein [Pirellulales bacterium]